VSLRIFLGHGASGTAASMAPFVTGLRRRGFAAEAVDLPKRKAEDAVPIWRAAVPDGPLTVVGGHSYGGRVASLAAAQPGAGYQAVVLFSYPLHAPGQPDRAAARVAHWPSIRCPVLLLSGEADPFARIQLLRQFVELLPDARLHTYPRLGHTLQPVLDDALDRVAAFLDEVAPGARTGVSGSR
jgi:pimeloyl-ACP methyl ester carboxylesterase